MLRQLMLMIGPSRIETYKVIWILIFYRITEQRETSSQVLISNSLEFWWRQKRSTFHKACIFQV